ncbi:MAG: hypothetical protein EOO46_20445 [Flavobacterium sp.]|nr:MAG: hypothetical protein EOO46_20445 [Flavobacterium sp.]
MNSDTIKGLWVGSIDNKIYALQVKDENFANLLFTSPGTDVVVLTTKKYKVDDGRFSMDFTDEKKSYKGNITLIGSGIAEKESGVIDAKMTSKNGYKIITTNLSLYRPSVIPDLVAGSKEILLKLEQIGKK